MIHRADKYLAQQHGRELEQTPGPALTLPVFSCQTTSLDDYHSAQEPSESKYDSGGTDPDELEDKPEEDEDNASMGSDSTLQIKWSRYQPNS